MNAQFAAVTNVETPDGGEVVESLDQGRITFDTSERVQAEVRDPVCGIGVPVAVGPTAVYNGVDYYFCGETCRREFISDPVKFVGRS
jgi:YHS domain-containing protein